MVQVKNVYEVKSYIIIKVKLVVVLYGILPKGGKLQEKTSQDKMLYLKIITG